MTTIAGAEAFASDGHGPNARTGVLLSHGFTGSPSSMLDWAQYLARQGYAVRLPLLPGHGTTWQDLARTPWKLWYQEYENAYRELSDVTDTVVAAGLSMGGTLALRLAAHQPVAGVVVVNPGLTFYDRRAPYTGLLKYFIRSVPPIANSISKENMDEGAYERTPVAAVHQLYLLFRSTIACLPRVTVPTLLFRSETDNVVPESSVELIRRHIGTRQLDIVRLENSYHVATIDNDAPLIFERSADFIHKLTAGADHERT
jgi:carboxylesterase